MKETVISTDKTVNKSQKITVNIRTGLSSSQKLYQVSLESDATLRDLLLKAGFRVSAKFFINSKGYLDLEYLNKKLYELGVENGCQLNIYKKYQDDGDVSLHIRPEATDIQLDKNCNQLDGYGDIAQSEFVFKLDPIYGKIKKFNSTLTKMQKMSIFPKWVMLDGKRFELVKDLTLYANLNEKNKFTNDKRVYDEVKSYSEYMKILFGLPVRKLPNVDKHCSKFKEMTNREFLKRFIKDLANKAKWYRPDSPKWKDILYFVGIFLGTHWFFYNSNEYPRLNCFLGALNIFAYAGLICYLVFNLSLAVLIPSVIVLGLLLLVNLLSVFFYCGILYCDRKIYGEDVKQFFNLFDEINKYLEEFDLPPKTISLSTEAISEQSSIIEKIEDTGTNKEEKNDKKEIDVEIEGDEHEKT